VYLGGFAGYVFSIQQNGRFSAHVFCKEELNQGVKEQTIDLLNKAYEKSTLEKVDKVENG
jgi:hypothetical protein